MLNYLTFFFFFFLEMFFLVVLSVLALCEANIGVQLKIPLASGKFCDQQCLNISSSFWQTSVFLEDSKVVHKDSLVKTVDDPW
jgi:hypothetical protein